MSSERLIEDDKKDLSTIEEGEEDVLTIDDVIDKIYTGVNLKIISSLILATSIASFAAMCAYITIFAGFIPYTEWACISEKCLGILATSNKSKEFYSRASMCDNKLEAGIDFNWTSNRTSFSMDWGFYCDKESKLSVTSSFFFIGAFLGLLSSTAIFDRIGRRNGTIIGSFIGAAATVIGTWVPTYERMLAIRVVQGYGQFINFTGVYCWVIEFAPSHLRNPISVMINTVWAFGSIAVVLISYFTPVWHHIYLTVGILNFLLIIPLFIYPISPRFALIRGKEEDAKRILETWSRVCNNTISLEAVTLDFKSRKQNYLRQLEDFITHPTMRRETMLVMFVWFVVAALFFGFDFGWGKLSTNLYITYLLSSMGELIGFTIVIPVCHWIGRKKTAILFPLCGILSTFLAMIDVQINETWTMEYVACLFGFTAIAATFAHIYLYTSELAPTSHRGMIMSLSSCSARVGSFIGTYINLLYDITDRRVPLGVIALASMLCVAAVFFLSDTTLRRIPETPQDVEVLRGEKNLNYHTFRQNSTRKES